MRYGFLACSAALTIILSSCLFHSKQGPIDKERSQLNTDSQKLTSEGDRLVKDGRALQSRATESRVVAASNRRQADVLVAQGKADEANQLRLQADQSDASANADESKGKDMEAQGLAKIGQGQDVMNRSNTLAEQQKRIEGSD